MMFYAAADIAFVGGSLIATVGGHNLLEPAVLGASDSRRTSQFQRARYRATDDRERRRAPGEFAEQLAAAILELYADPAARADMGARANAIVAENRGALSRVMELIDGIETTDDAIAGLPEWCATMRGLPYVHYAVCCLAAIPMATRSPTEELLAKHLRCSEPERRKRQDHRRNHPRRASSPSTVTRPPSWMLIRRGLPISGMRRRSRARPYSAGGGHPCARNDEKAFRLKIDSPTSVRPRRHRYPRWPWRCLDPAHPCAPICSSGLQVHLRRFAGRAHDPQSRTACSHFKAVDEPKYRRLFN